MKKYIYLLAVALTCILSSCDVNNFEVQYPDDWVCEYKTLPFKSGGEEPYEIWLVGETEIELPIGQLAFIMSQDPDFETIDDVIVMSNNLSIDDDYVTCYIDKRIYLGKWYYKLARYVNGEWVGSENTESFSTDISMVMAKASMITDQEVLLEATFETPYYNYYYGSFVFELSTNATFEDLTIIYPDLSEKNENSIIFKGYATKLTPASTYYVRARISFDYTNFISNVEQFTTSKAHDTNRPLKGEFNGHEYVDLGLPSGLLWATCNVGANTPYEYGNYFRWEGSLSDNLSLLYDQARKEWGATWHIPSYSDYKELENHCKFTRESVDGKNILRISGPNGQSIILPACGYKSGGYSYSINEEGYYRTCNSMFDNFDKIREFGYFYFVLYRNANNFNSYTSYQSYIGSQMCSIRAVAR